MNTQDLINQALSSKGMHCDGYRQFSDEVDGIQCEIITRSHPGTWKREGRPDTQRIQFWNYTDRISRAEAENILSEQS